MLNSLPLWLQAALAYFGGGSAFALIVFAGYLGVKHVLGMTEKRKDLAEIDAQRIKSLKESFDDDKLLREKMKAKYDEQISSLAEELEGHKLNLDMTDEALSFFVGRAEVTNFMVGTVLATANHNIVAIWNDGLDCLCAALEPLLLNHPFDASALQRTVQRVFKDREAGEIKDGFQYEILLEINRQLKPLIRFTSVVQIQSQVMIDALEHYSAHPDKEPLEILEMASKSSAEAEMSFGFKDAVDSLNGRLDQLFKKVSDLKIERAKAELLATL